MSSSSSQSSSSSAQQLEPLAPSSQLYLATCFPPGCPKQRDVPIDVGRVNMETLLRRHGGPYLSVRRTEDLTLRSLDGKATFKIRVYWPHLPSDDDDSTTEALPVLLYAHGGGWVKGSRDTHDQLCRRLAVGSGHVVVAVDYRLSPEARFPEPLDDLEAAYRWIRAQPGMDSTRLCVAGDSAGGNLVAALAVRLLGRPDVRPEHLVKRQALIYPILDMAMGGASYATYGEGYGLTTASVQYYVEAYLGPAYTQPASPEAKEALVRNPEVSPLFYEGRVRELPETLVLSARQDVFLSDGEAYIRKLREADVPARHKIYDGLVHAYMMLFDMFPEATEGVKEICSFLKTGR